MTRARDLASGSGIEAGEVVPHIIPGVLYPAVGGKGIDGSTTVTSFGTDFPISGYATLKYYYTDIKGSKPIRDPRIGAHFGSQRHKFKSIQQLEQETATHGENVYSVDGREWMRAVGNFVVNYDTIGNYIEPPSGTAGYIEIVGYFSDANAISHTEANRTYRYTIDGGTEDTTDFGSASVQTPLRTRYVDSGAVINLGLGATLGIHTLKIRDSGSATPLFHGIELIAHDTSNVNEIKIPKQNVVSYGKKFEVGSDTLGDAVHPHYNPFAQDQAGTDVDIDDNTSHGSVATGWAGTGSGYFDDTLDTATSLGLSAWVQNSKYYRPVNGGRVVRWVDSSGSIKTSVNMMPPAGTSIGASSDTNTPEANDWTTDYQPLFSSTTIDHSIAEVAKTFHWREFGNGAANQGSDTSGTLQDASMLNTADDIAYCMDDGLTSLSGDNVYTSTHLFIHSADASVFYITFIGTGVGITVSSNGSTTDEYDKFIDGVQIRDGAYARTSGVTTQETLAQNLPYGTHILKLERTSAQVWNELYTEVTFHQPKRPPIPEDACVIADYMLMADWVASTGDQYTISKGARYQSCSRDMFYDNGTNMSFLFSQGVGDTLGWKNYCSEDITSGTATTKLPYFGTHFSTKFYASYDGTVTSGSDGAQSVTSSDQGSGYSARQNHTYATLGANTFKSVVTSGYWHFNDMEVHTPIHTSSHYQSFETPFLHELVGGDRNMEQTNLIVTPDGKTWDEVTRDVSYIGNLSFLANSDTGESSTNPVIFDEYRGVDSEQTYCNKDFAIAYDRQICLRAGLYQITVGTTNHTADSGGDTGSIYLNGLLVAWGMTTTSGSSKSTNVVPLQLQRGDYLQVKGRWRGHLDYNQYNIIRLSN